MLTVVIDDNGEDSVTQFTYELLWRELKDIPDSELIISKNWLAELKTIKNKYICFVEADCLVSSGYFTSMMGLFKKDPYLRKLGMLSSVTGVNNFANRFYGYSIDHGRVTPNRHKRSGVVDAVQVGYVPGSIIRVSMLKDLLETAALPSRKDLVEFSTAMSLAFWRQGDGNRVHLNPNAVYVTTEKYVNDLGQLKIDANDLLEKFERESI